MSVSSPSCLSLEQRAQRQHRRAEAELQVHRRGHPALLAASAGCAAPRSRSRPIGFCIRTAAPSGSCSRIADDLIAGHGKVEDRALDRRRLLAATRTRKEC